MREMPVLVTGVGGGGVGEQVMTALRLADASYRIIGTDADPMSLGLFLADKSYLVPRAEDESYLPKLIQICRKENVRVVIPGSELELTKISKNRRLFKNRGILPLINTHSVISTCQNKWKTYLFLLKNGFKVPPSHLPTKDLDAESLNYPVVIKPFKGSGGSRDLFMAFDAPELSFFIRYLKKRGVSSMIQGYIGSPENEYTVGVLTSFKGELLGSIAVKRRLVGRLFTLYNMEGYRKGVKRPQTFRISTGVSQGFIEDFAEVRKTAEKIALKLKSKGPINIQCRLAEDGVYAFEINPRFSGTESIRALVGYNAPDVLIRREVLGEPLKKIEYKRGLVLRKLQNWYISFDDYTKMAKLGYIENDQSQRRMHMT